MTAKVIAGADRLRAIARAGVGVDNIDLEAATARGILVLNTAEASTLSTAEHALALYSNCIKDNCPYRSK